MQINVHDAKTTLSRLIARVEAGEEVILTRRNVPVARIVPYEERAPKRVFGTSKGKYEVPAVFFEPLPEDESKQWDG